MKADADRKGGATRNIAATKSDADSQPFRQIVNRDPEDEQPDPGEPPGGRPLPSLNEMLMYNMYGSPDYSATPRPMYPVDGRKIPDHYAHPPELRDELNERLGQFPLFNFWGPTANIASSGWIARLRFMCSAHANRR